MRRFVIGVGERLGVIKRDFGPIQKIITGYEEWIDKYRSEEWSQGSVEAYNEIIKSLRGDGKIAYRRTLGMREHAARQLDLAEKGLGWAQPGEVQGRDPETGEEFKVRTKEQLFDDYIANDNEARTIAGYFGFRYKKTKFSFNVFS